MAFPKLSNIISDSQIKIEQRYLVKKYELILDLVKCVGCGQCSIVCPKEAIIIKKANQIEEDKINNSKPSIFKQIDEQKCVYCGTCQVFCPFDAISIKEDGDNMKFEDMNIIKHNSLPHLESTIIQCSNPKQDAKIYWDGKIDIKFEMQSSQKEFEDYFNEKCHGECQKCEKVCPTDAISFKTVEDAWKLKKLIEVDDEKCIKCGACVLVCPQENFQVSWSKINTLGSYNQIFWDPIKERLLEQKVVFIEKNKDIS